MFPPESRNASIAAVRENCGTNLPGPDFGRGDRICDANSVPASSDSDRARSTAKKLDAPLCFAVKCCGCFVGFGERGVVFLD